LNSPRQIRLTRPAASPWNQSFSQDFEGQAYNSSDFEMPPQP
jgi:hypothetical protein